jgi:O-antigen/teichoic acid export membrane protein
MTPKRILIALFFLMMVDGAIDATYSAGAEEAPIGWSLALALTFSFLCFVWYRHDSDERHYARSRWLNIGMVVLTVFAMPYYLARSRPRGQKLRALARCAGFALLLVLATAIGMVLSGHAI